MTKAPHLRKILGSVFGIAIVVGSTIGVGILRTPGEIAMLVPNAPLIMACWLIIGLYIMLAASSYAELTVMMPKAGGAYNYIRRAFGHGAGYILGWFDFLNNAIAPAFFCIVLGEYTLAIFPYIPIGQTAVGLLYLSFFCMVNLPGVRGGSTFQKTASFLKIALFLVLVGGCFLTHPEISSRMNHFAFTGAAILGVFKALQLIMGTYDGWMAVSFFAEEDSDPARHIPKSYLIGAGSVLVLYLLINGAMLYSLPIEAISKSPLAAATAASAAFGKWGGTLVTALSVFSVVSILNAYIMIPPRIVFGMGRDGFAPSAFTKINRGGTPYIALLACFGFDAILIATSSFEPLFALATFMMTVITGFAFASVIVLRKREPDVPRPYKAWGYPFSTFLLLLVTMALLTGFVFGDPLSAAIVAGIALLQFAVYRFAIKKPS
jgi:APA family basic amino acid/polyamine antiporter